MGKVRKIVMGDVTLEKEQKRRAVARRETKKAKKAGGARTAIVEGTELKPEIKELIEKVEGGKPASAKATARQRKQAGPRIRGKKYQEAAKLIDKNKFYPLVDAISLVKKTSITKFDGTVEIHINLNQATLSTKGDKKDFRGVVTFPHGTGKTVRVVVADEALIENVEKGIIDFDVLVAHPSMMPKLAKVARVLGPKGLMPNPKTGTVTTDVEKRIKELSQGQVNFKTEPDQPILHLGIGKVSFEDKKLQENVLALIESIGRNKITKATLTATMGPGIKLDLTTSVNTK